MRTGKGKQEMAKWLKEGMSDSWKKEARKWHGGKLKEQSKARNMDKWNICKNGEREGGCLCECDGG